MAVDKMFLQRLQDKLPNDAWFVYAGIVLQANDQMDIIAELWNAVKDKTPSPNAQVIKARKLREAFLKTSVLVGFPKTSPEVEEQLDKDKSLRQQLQREEKYARGLEFFSKVYAQHTDRVLRNGSLASGGDLAEFAINAIYGDLMAEESRLSAKETGLLVGALQPWKRFTFVSIVAVLSVDRLPLVPKPWIFEKLLRRLSVLWTPLQHPPYKVQEFLFAASFKVFFRSL
ncbi:hypothetical protein ARSEF1564_007066 [Beauveria bassiana]